MSTKIAFVLLSALGATAVLPAIATPSMAVERRDFDEVSVLRQLQDKGVEASSVEEWNGYVRAYVRLNGVETMQYFDADTLEPVNI